MDKSKRTPVALLNRRVSARGQAMINPRCERRPVRQRAQEEILSLATAHDDRGEHLCLGELAQEGEGAEDAQALDDGMLSERGESELDDMRDDFGR